MKKTLGILTFILIFILEANAQGVKLSGTLLNASDQSTLIGATVRVALVKDSIHPKYTTSDINGNFTFTGLTTGKYRLTVTYIGFKTYYKVLTLTGKVNNVGNLSIEVSATTLKEVSVVGEAIRAEQKSDTAQYNAAAFKVNKDASTEDLITKMPGITVQNGTYTAHGETIQKVLDDGKPFFGDDAATTLKNLPAEVVDKVQVFDKLSDQAAWTGFDDGNSQKTLNIVTRKDKNHGIFGKFIAGYGEIDQTEQSLVTENPYQLNANINMFRGSEKLTVLAMSNNVNDQNFGSGDFLGAGGFAGGGMRMLMGGNRGATGITTSNAIGVNYNNSWKDKVSLSASYFFNKSNSSSETTDDRQYLSAMLPYKYYNDTTLNTSASQNHRMNLRLEWAINSNNDFIWTPRFNVQVMNSNSLSNQNFLNTDQSPYGSTYSDNSGKSHGINFNNDFLYRHKFSKPGRTLSIDLGTAVNNRKRENYLDALQLGATDSTNQYSHAITDGLSLSSNIVYTEPINLRSQFQVNYNISYTKNKNDKETYNHVHDGVGYLNTPIDSLSNIYDNHYLTHTPGIGYLYKTPNVTMNAGVSYQLAILDGSQTFPKPGTTNLTFTSVLPSFWLNYKFNDNENLRFFIRSNSNPPSVTQLQDVVDNTNPMFLSVGNPDLHQEIRYMSNARFSLANKEKTRNLFAMMFFTKTLNAISNATYIAANDTTISGTILKKGGQVTKPVNLDGSWSLRTLITYGLPINPIKCNINFNTGLSLNHTPSLINLAKNLASTYGMNEGVVLSSNINENVDFTVTYNFTYNLVKNSLQTASNNNYIYQIASTNVRWQFWKGFFVQSNVTYQNYNTLSTHTINEYNLWNASFGSKLFKNQTGEIKLTAFDILNQNRSFSHNVTDTYVEDVNTTVLRQYFLVTFTYNLRKFSGKIPDDMNRQNDRGGFQRTRMGGPGGMGPGGGGPGGPPPGGGGF